LTEALPLAVIQIEAKRGAGGPVLVLHSGHK